MKKYLTIGTVALLIACSTVPITGRKRINFVSDDEIFPASFQQYNDFLKTNTLSTNKVKTAEIKEVGAKISAAVVKFMNKNDMAEEAAKYQWEFNLVENKELNAWCLPGGKVVFYSGILPIAANKDGIAAVMGHEVAHAFAKHGQERMSSSQIQQLGGVAVAVGTSGKSAESQQIWNTVYGLGSQVGMLKYSRKHETEADKLGLVFMIMAGYNGEEAIKVWERMSAQGENAVPEFLSTHPSHETRINDLRAFLPEAKKLAIKYS